MGFNLDPINFIGIMLGIIIGATVHEFMHAYTAVMLGDNTPRRDGRITLNPVAHFDPFGFLLFVLMALGVGFFAMAKPVMINPGALRNGRIGGVMVALAGPLSNLVLGAVFALPFRLGLTDNLPDPAVQILSSVMWINFVLFVFNLIPLPPLDGSHVLEGLFSPRWSLLMQPLRRYGYMPILVLILLPTVLGSTLGGARIDVIGRIIGPVLTLLSSVFAGTPS